MDKMFKNLLFYIILVAILVTGGYFVFIWLGEKKITPPVDMQEEQGQESNSEETAKPNESVTSVKEFQTPLNVNFASRQINKDTVTYKKQTRLDLKITWTNEPIEVDPSSLGLSVNDPYAWDGIEEGDIYEVYKVGTISSAPFTNNSMYLIERNCLGPCGSVHYRVIDDKENQSLVLLSNFSHDVDESDKVFFNISDEYNIPDLIYPSSFVINDGKKELVFEAESFSPATLFKVYTSYGEYNSQTREYSDRNLKSKLRHPVYGVLYEEVNEGYFIFKLPDHTIKLYRLQFPFQMEGTSAIGALAQVINLSLDLPRGEDFIASYTLLKATVCPPRVYNITQKPSDNLIKIGESDFYLFEDLNQEVYNSIFRAGGERLISAPREEYPIIFWRDILNRWFVLLDTKYSTGAETECFYFNSVL